MGPVLLVLFLTGLDLVWSDSSGDSCLESFSEGKQDFVLDLNDSVSSGATFLSSPNLSNLRDCKAACCRTLGCNLVLVQPGHRDEDTIHSCFLLNCVYQQEFVCKFSRKQGLVSYVTMGVQEALLTRRNQLEGDDDPPLARVSRDVKTQPLQTVTLSGIESWDKEGIADYKWILLDGDPAVVMERIDDEPYLLIVSNLERGQYIIELIVTDTSSQTGSATTTITVLSKEETEEYCLAPMKVGRCRAKFMRWYYDPETNDCKEFTYGGCKPNKNNYVRKEDCLQSCRDVPEQSHKESRRLNPVCDGHCLRTQFQCADGCCINAALECDDTPDCSDQSDEASCENYDKGFKTLQLWDDPNNKARCVEFPDTGSCRASFSRWYYDPESMTCMAFTYGGCGGNGNNFKSERDCLRYCTGISDRDIFDKSHLDPEAREAGSGSVEVAIAVFLGICILIVLAVIGYCYMKKKKASHRRQPNVNNSAVLNTEDTEHLVYNRTTKPV
ncbi:kunitz-type protease inhibitor 1 [Pelobates fuscus]|uniref:kunitz-type protease inhibitor 1 n=1 Tax=Pelobates fuscus TaxID=191477 RepID=UPI002FE434CF